MSADLELGARTVPGGVRFRVWAPRARQIEVKVRGDRVALVPGEHGMFEVTVQGASAGDDYSYVIDRVLERPDPVSRWQPHGVHGPSRVVDPSAFAWHDTGWRGVPLEQYIIYELHIGTFTPEGTFASAITKLRHLVDLGITAVEIMPVAEFPGGRNWGYDGVHLFAPQSTYGGPDGLRSLVDACHREGLAVVLDVVYNHLGPEGNYIGDYAPFFTNRYRTPWGPAINLDDADSDGVRRHLVSNAVHWIDEYHVDALRLDAIHGIFDASPRHFLDELHGEVRAAAPDRHVHVIAESDLNDVRVLRPSELGGYGLEAQWSDDFHHAVRTVLTRDTRGYFSDYGAIAQVGKAITDSFVFDGTYSSHRGRRHGSAAVSYPGEQFVICIQNHDQIANGSQGRRLSTIIGERGHALAATLLMTAPNLPMLFMGEEYAARAPFMYFISHSDASLITAVREGRRHELGELDALSEFLDPQDETTFRACKLDWTRAGRSPHAEMLALYRDLIRLRRRERCLANCRKDLTRASSSETGRWLVIERADPSARCALVMCNVGDVATEVPCPAASDYELALATDDPRYAVTSAATLPHSAATLSSNTASVLLPPLTARIYLSVRQEEISRNGRDSCG